jgi:hypothetical protein
MVFPVAFTTLAKLIGFAANTIVDRELSSFGGCAECRGIFVA